MDGSVVAALAGVGMGFIACTATCVVCRVFRRTRYYKKVQHSLEEEERAFQARLAMKHGGDESVRQFRYDVEDHDHSYHNTNNDDDVNDDDDACYDS